MRLLYLVIGFLLGLWIVSDKSVLIMDELNKQHDRDALIYTLTGYHEGWARGKYHTAQKLFWIVMDTQQELEMCYRREGMKK